MKKYAVYTHYDDSKTIIGYIVPNIATDGTAYITQCTYNRLMQARTIGGTAGIYSDYPDNIRVTNNEQTEYLFDMQ